MQEIFVKDKFPKSTSIASDALLRIFKLFIKLSELTRLIASSPFDETISTSLILTFEFIALIDPDQFNPSILIFFKSLNLIFLSLYLLIVQSFRFLQPSFYSLILKMTFSF